MKKKIVALLCTAVMAAGVMGGCGNSSTPQSESGTAESSQPASESKEESSSSTADTPTSDVTLQIVTWNDQNDTMYALSDAFTAKTGIKVEYQFLATSNADYQQKAGIMMNGGTYFDALFIVDGAQLPPLVDKGYIEPLDDYIDRDINKEDYSGKIDAFTFDDGKTYAMPVRGDYYMIFYNKDLFDEYNVSYPTDDMTWDEFEQLTYKFPGKDENVYGCYLFNWPGMVSNWAWQSGEYDMCSGTYDCLKPEYERVLRMQDAGSIIDYAVLASGSGDAAFENGNIAMVLNGTWGVGQCINATKEGDITFNWDVAHLPYHDDNDKGNVIGSITPIAMNTISEHKDETWEFIKFCAGEEGAKIFASFGSNPALTTDEVIEAYTNKDGAPANLKNAMKCTGFCIDKPAKPYISEYKQILADEHSLIMLKEETIDEGIANINKRAAEVGK